MKRNSHARRLGAVALAVVLVGGCSLWRKPETPADLNIPPQLPTPDEVTGVEPASLAPAQLPEGEPVTEPFRQETVPEPELQPVYFDYDSDDLRKDTRDVLDLNAAFLLDNPAAKVQVEGHCDERGTPEYNLSLGQRRAAAVAQYLVRKGVEPGRLFVISYGEDRPIAFGMGEDVWWQNRRVEFRRVAE